MSSLQDPISRPSEDSVDAEEYLLAPKNNVSKKWAIVITALVVTMLLFFVATITLTILLVHELEGTSKPKNFILMVSDGFGPASETFARNYATHRAGEHYSYQLALDTILVGASRTRSSDSLVTDSAAGATAFSCAIKSYNGAIAVDENGKPCPTVLEAAKLKGMRTGLVATSRITHATPASFASHVIHRDMENEIAVQEVETMVDLMFGGGRRHFIPQSESGSSRTDDKDVLKMAKDLGYTVSIDRQTFDSIDEKKESLPVLGLYGLSDLGFELDRQTNAQPTLLEMASKALNILSDATKSQSQGFFIMIEGSRIDHAAHANDAAAHYYEILQYQKTVEMVKKFIDEHPNTVMVSVSDHECGGLTVGRGLDYNPEYLWYPEVIDNVKNSTGVLSTALKKFTGTPEEQSQYITTILADYLGIEDATQEELAQIASYMDSNESTAQQHLAYHLSEMVNVRAMLGFTTVGHTGVDVNLYAYGTYSGFLRGNVENTEVGDFIVEALGLNLAEVVLSGKRGSRKDQQEAALDKVLDEWHRIQSH